MSKRNINVDLARIIATILIITLHVLGQGGILQSAPPYRAAYWIAWFLEICAYCAVNCFALISGYVMVNKGVKLKSILGLWFQVLFYSLLFSALFFILLPETRTEQNIVFSFLPVLGKQWWYVTAYFGLFLMIPILNAAVNTLSQSTMRNILITILLGVCIADCILPNDTFVLQGGYSAAWLILLYLFGAYMKKYNTEQKATALKSLLGFFAMITLTFLSKVALHYGKVQILGNVNTEDILISYTSITIVFAAIFLFLFCQRIKINAISAKVIGFFAPATLGVYLIHVHPMVFSTIIKNAFATFPANPIILMIAYILLAIIGMFLVCSMIDLLRIQLFKLIRVSKACEWIDSKVNALLAKIWKA